MSSQASPRALVVLRVAHAAPPPDPTQVRAAIATDRRRLGLPAEDGLLDFRVAGPYTVVVDGQQLDEYVAWEA